ncbi:unnamed protein product [Phytophthora lilii]|uniref:Unnamed protein product n=1 Tax=Phytophthora lilii TaxID=2077276 RepID=A0A9W6TCI9_9STRA|nr:unnamed protein product [Phytophthora lilii]
MCDAEDAALLQRARRLVLQLQRPASKSTQSGGVSRERLPAIAASPAPPEPPRRKKTKAHRDKRAQEEAKRLGEERKRHERELDKVKQAQERARARVARTNQLEQQQTLRAVEQQHSEVASAAEQCAEKIRKVQQSRRRAKERVRVKRLEKLADTPPPSSAPDLRAEPEKVKAFHRETFSRLQMCEQAGLLILWH